MKKLMIITVIIISSFLFIYKPASAACYGVLIVDEVTYGCSDAYPWNTMPDGVTVSIDDKKIILNNYEGGPIGITSNDYGFDDNYNIELIGNNIIHAAKFRDSDANRYPDASNVAFFNIAPSFSGYGSLKIVDTTVPFAFDDFDSNSFTITIMGSDSNGIAIDSSENGDALTAGANDNASVIDTQNNSEELSFFETTLGIVLLITVPGILLAIIVVLSVLLMKSKKSNSFGVNNSVFSSGEEK